MYKFLLIAVWTVFIFSLVPFISAQSEAPYLYYYSENYQRIIVEHADGTDTRFIEIGTHVPWFGPGFSPDGQWFASSAFQNLEASSSIVSVDGTRLVNALNPLRNVLYMEWSPNSRYMLVSGSFDDCDPFCRYRTYWLIDVEANEIVAFVHSFPLLGSPREHFVTWTEDREAVSFYVLEENSGRMAASTYQVTMFNNGNVTKQNITYEEYDAAYPVSDESLSFLSQIELVSPDGRYSISAYSELTDNISGTVTRLPVPDFDPDPNSSYAGSIVEAHWDASGDWVILGYSLDTGGAWGAAVMRSDGSDYRQLSACGFEPSCVGWLPDSVDVERLTPLEDGG